MNQNFLDTIYLFSCGAKGIEPQIECRNIDYKEVYSIAKVQGVWETVFLSYIKINRNHPDIIPKELFQEIHFSFMKRCAGQFKRYAFIHDMLNKFSSYGIRYCVLKGESIARFYDVPIARVSSDVDILIDPKKTDLCLRIMKEIGFDIGDKVYESHQIECRHPIAGLVEIHTRMYGKRTEDVCFNNKITYIEEYLDVAAEDGMIYQTLGITDNFLFIFLHFMKHFLSAGVGFRQLEDIFIYTEKNYKEINWDRVDSVLESLGFDKFFKCIIAIGKQYFSFPETLFSAYAGDVDHSLIEKVFDDMMQGGVFGHNDPSRHGFYDLYLNERYKKFEHKSYSQYKNKRKLMRLFPNRKFLSVNFPYVEKSILLMPIAWIHRIVLGLFKSKNCVQADTQLSQAHKGRMMLMQELEIL